MNIKYEEEAFEGMHFKIYGMPGDQSVFKVYPELAQRKEMHIVPPKAKGREKMAVTGDMVLRYIIYLYDPGTPLSATDNINERKQEALALAGIDIGASKKYSKYMETIIGGTNKPFNDAVIGFLRMAKKPLWSTMKVMEQMYYNKLTDVLDGVGNVTMQQLNKDRQEMEKLTDDYFGAVKSDSLLSQFYNYINQEQLTISVEDVVRILNNGDEVFPEIKAYELEKADQ